MTDEAPGPTLNINYLKPASFREVPCDGVIGSVTPHQKLWIAFYSERAAVPQVVRHKLVPGDAVGELRLAPGDVGVPIEGRSGLVRNMEVGVYMSLATAEELHRWLGEQVAALKGENNVERA